MLTKILTAVALAIATFTIYASYTQKSALVLREEQTDYWSRRGTQLSGSYRGGTWVPLPNRASYGGFRGGGPSAGK